MTGQGLGDGDPGPSAGGASDGNAFDASQYAFFSMAGPAGNAADGGLGDALGDELGGLEDEDEALPLEDEEGLGDVDVDVDEDVDVDLNDLDLPHKGGAEQDLVTGVQKLGLGAHPHALVDGNAASAPGVQRSPLPHADATPDDWLDSTLRQTGPPPQQLLAHKGPSPVPPQPLASAPPLPGMPSPPPPGMGLPSWPGAPASHLGATGPPPAGMPGTFPMHLPGVPMPPHHQQPFPGSHGGPQASPPPAQHPGQLPLPQGLGVGGAQAGRGYSQPPGQYPGMPGVPGPPHPSLSQLPLPPFHMAPHLQGQQQQQPMQAQMQQQQLHQQQQGFPMPQGSMKSPPPPGQAWGPLQQGVPPPGAPYGLPPGAHAQGPPQAGGAMQPGAANGAFRGHGGPPGLQQFPPQMQGRPPYPAHPQPYPQPQGALPQHPYPGQPYPGPRMMHPPGPPDLSTQFGLVTQRELQPPPPGSLRGSAMMTADEVAMIVRMHWASANAAAREHDPYQEDYYHQARQFKLACAQGLRRHFAPASAANLLNGGPQGPGYGHHSQAFLPMEGLGRVPVPSIRRPRPLLDVEGLEAAPQTSSLGPALSSLARDAARRGKGGAGAVHVANGDAAGEKENVGSQDPSGTGKAKEGAPSKALSKLKPLEQEPLMAARIAIEDGMCLLLSVDDVDRLWLSLGGPGMAPWQGTRQMFPGLQMRRKALLDALVASFHLGDPFDDACPIRHLHALSPFPDAKGLTVPLSAEQWSVGVKEDVVFLRLASLPKGRKLIVRFLRLLPPGSDQQRLVLLVFFRHLRRLLASATNVSAANSPAPGGPDETPVAITLLVVDAAGHAPLPVATACLWAFALSPEAPILRPLGAPGDSATLVLRTVLDNASSALTKLQAQGPDTESKAGQAGAEIVAGWRRAFDAFFIRVSELLCFDAILSSLPLPAQAAQALSKEMPLELLRAALPHTSQKQKDLVGALLHGLLSSSGQ